MNKYEELNVLPTQAVPGQEVTNNKDENDTYVTKYVWPDDAAIAEYPEMEEQKKRCDVYFERVSILADVLKRKFGENDPILRIYDWKKEGNRLLRSSKKTQMGRIPADQVHQNCTSEEIDELMMQIMDKVSQLHECGIVCSDDLNPEHVYLVRKEDGTVVPQMEIGEHSFIAGDVPCYEDFELNAYSSPEEAFYVKHHAGRASASCITAAADQYSLTLLWYTFLTGRLPRIPFGCKAVYEASEKRKDILLSWRLTDLQRSVVSRMLEAIPMKRYPHLEDAVIDYRTSCKAMSKTFLTNTEILAEDPQWNNRFAPKKTTPEPIAEEKEEETAAKASVEDALLFGAGEKLARAIDYRNPEHQHFEFPVLGRYTDIERCDEDSYWVTSTSGRRYCVPRKMLGFYGFSAVAEPLYR